MRFTSLIMVVVGLEFSSEVAAKVSSSLLRRLKEAGTTTILISFKASNVSRIRDGLIFPQEAARAHRASAIYTALKSHADETQANVLQILSKHRSSHSFEFRQLWITNQVAVKKVDLELVEKLGKMDEISKIEEDIIVPMYKPVEEINHPESYVPQAGVQWGVAIMEAPAVWANGNRGAGAVIAGIDTGVRGTHEALRDGYQSTNGWYDAVKGSKVPIDTDGHGTHTMSTIVGRTRGIGVAPEAKWMACRACDDRGCSSVDLIDCGQWVVCPTKPDGVINHRCDLAPCAVSNSWGGDHEDPFYSDVIATWITAGIVPLFAIGNSGPRCSSANSPGDHENVIGVGSTDREDKVSSFSSVGPTAVTKRMKPEIAAPGSSIYSAVASSDTAYSTHSGTSMACPHAAGLTALLFSQRSNLTVSEIRQLLTAGAQPTKPTGRNCGGVSEDTYPNHHVGAGRISAKASVDALVTLP